MVFCGASLTTGWGEGLQHIPARADVAAGTRQILPLLTPEIERVEQVQQFETDRLRRASRECLLAITAVEHALRTSRLSANDLAGQRTALVYASASSYMAANWAFLHADTSQAVYFPYTAPSAVPGEVSMYFNITGPYLAFLSGANAGLEAVWQATTLLSNDQCDRALVLGVETFVECAQLYLSGRRLLSLPLVETSLCLILERQPNLAEVRYQAGNCANRLAHNEPDELDQLLATLADQAVSRPPSAIAVCGPTVQAGQHLAQQLAHQQWPSGCFPPVSVVNTRTGSCLAATPLIGLLLALAEAQHEQIVCLSRWGEAWSMLCWPGSPA